MSTISNPIRPSVRPSASVLPPLEAGDRLDQATFHARYEAMPPGVKAELIGGVVYMPSPVRSTHGKPHAALITALGVYAAASPGVTLLDNTTTILADDSEPQPDAGLLTIGGQTSVTDDHYVMGAPELVCEVASSTESIDLHAKKADYEKYGAKEYLVVAARSQRVLLFVRDSAGRFIEADIDSDGLFKSRVYPGLWIDPAALLRGDLKAAIDAVHAGVRSRQTTP